MAIKDCCNTKKSESLTPLYVLIAGIFIMSFFLFSLFPSNTFMMYLMGVWFLAFGIMKLPNISAFAHSFSQYDLIAQKVYGYGYVYPFIEIGLGLLYILNTQMFFMQEINILALIISFLGIVSAYRVIVSGKKILCACMGTYWKLPMTKVTILENGMMFLMIVYMMLFPSSMMNMKMMDMGAANTSSTPTDMSSQMREECKMMPKMAGCEAYR